MRRAVLALALALVGCGVKDRSVVTIKLDAAKLVIDQKDGKHHELAMDGHGAVTWDGAPVGRINTHAVFYLGSKEALRLVKGDKTMVGGFPANVVVHGDGTLLVDDETELSIAADGAVTGPLIDTLDHPRFDPTGGTIEYVGPPAERQPMMLVMAGFVTKAGQIPLP